MTTRLRIGYVPLTDAALLHVAKAQHFAAARGVEIELVADSSWANIRDKLVAGHFDAAHMLAPAAIAVSLGIGQIEAPLVAPVALGLNGNAITVSQALFETLLHEAQGDLADPRVTAKALARIVARRRAAGEAPLTFGHVFPFSSHHYQLRLWLRAGDLDPDEDVRLVVVPPPFMVWTLRKGQLDGFCVGAPWNSLAVAAGRRDHPPSWPGHRPRLPGKGPGFPGRMGAVAWGRCPRPRGSRRRRVALGGGAGQPELPKDAAHEHGLARREPLDDRKGP